MNINIAFCTLGPEGTCHDEALKHFIKFQNITNFIIKYREDFFLAAEDLIKGEVDFIIQNCAHPTVAELAPRYNGKIYIVDSFVYPAKSMGVLHNKKMKNSELILGIMPAAVGYIDTKKWNKLIYEISNPIVMQKLLKGEYGYGVTFTEYVQQYPDDLEIVINFGERVDSAWIVYSRYKKCNGSILGNYQPNYYIQKRKPCVNN